MGLYGIYGSHTTEACPLNNAETRKLVLEHGPKIVEEASKLNIKNRYKQLTKPLIRLFQNTNAVNEIIKSLSKYLIEKNQKKIDSFDSSLLTLVIDLVAENGTILYNERIWEELKTKVS